MPKRLAFAIFGSLLVVSVFVGAADTVSLGDATEQALMKSKLTSPGNKPFHLKVSIKELDEPDSDYQATIEEDWITPTKWRRVIESPDFSQTLVTNGDAVSETNKGDYFPFWLNNFVIAVTDLLPAPMLDVIKKVDLKISRPPRGLSNSNTCADLPARVDRWVICFEGHGLFASVFTKGYFAEFKGYEKFGDKWVARSIRAYPEPGTTIEARVVELDELKQPSEKLFEVEQPTPLDQRIRSVRVDEDMFRKMSMVTTEIDWPTVGEGVLTGGCAVYASADRAGQVREVWPEGCDNAALQDPLREAVKKWRLHPAAVQGIPVQVESLMGFAFHTTIDKSKSLPELSDSEARKLAIDPVEPIFPPGSAPSGTEFIFQISVDETGKLTGVGNSHGLATPIFGAASNALTKWHFKPYIKNGKPQYFHAEIVFHMQ